MAFDVNNLTGAQIANVEDLAKQSIATFGDENFPQARLIFALAFQAHRANGGGGTYNAFMAETTMEQAQALLGIEDDPADEPDDEAGDAGDADELTVADDEPADGADFQPGPGLLPR